MISDITITSFADWIPVLSLAATSIAIIVGIYEYNRRERWKQKIILSNFLEEFHSDRRNRSALNMLNYDGGVVDLFPEYDLDTLQIDGETVPSFQRVSFSEVALSLTCDPEKMKNMDMKLFRIRGIFNYMLNDLEKLNLFMKGKLFKPEDVFPFIDYYIDIISGQNKNFHDDPHVLELRKYIVAFDFEEAQELIEILHPKAFEGIKRP